MSILNAKMHVTDWSRSGDTIYPITNDTNINIKTRNSYSRSYTNLADLIDAFGDIAFLSAISVAYDSNTETLTIS